MKFHYNEWNCIIKNKFPVNEWNVIIMNGISLQCMKCNYNEWNFIIMNEMSLQCLRSQVSVSGLKSQFSGLGSQISGLRPKVFIGGPALVGLNSSIYINIYIYIYDIYRGPWAWGLREPTFSPMEWSPPVILDLEAF